MRTHIKIAIFVMVLGCFVASCGRTNGADASERGSIGSEKEDPDAKFYSFTLEPGAITAGQEAIVTITVVPTKGYKWNDEYPAKFVVSAADGVTLGKTEFKAMAKDIVPKDRLAAFKVPINVGTPGSRALTLKGGFSVCNKTSCKIFRKKTIELTIDVN